MNDENETLELDLEESNDLSFKVSVQGASQKPSAYRLICEAEKLSFGFSGSPDDEGNIVFTIPPMEKYLTSNSLYECAVEVLVEGRFFRPIKFGVKFKQSVKCVVENLNVKQTKNDLIEVAAKRKVPEVVKQPIFEETFSLKVPTKKLIERVAPASALREKVLKRTITGLDDETMKSVAKSVMERLIAKDFDGKGRK